MKSKLFSFISSILVCTVLLFGVHPNTVFTEPLPVGKSSYLFEEKTGVTGEPIKIYTYRPAGWQPGKVIVFVFHGSKRKAQNYRSGWISHADENNLLIICPEFTKTKYPGSTYYNTGNVMHRKKGREKLQPKDRWVFPVIDRIIRDVKSKMDAYESPAVVFGHSAGAQLLHRYALLGGNTDASLIMPANAGLYTMPKKNIPFPYGLGGVPIKNAELAEAFAKPVVVLLGEADVKPIPNPRRIPEADSQGLNRLARGKKFYRTARKKAEKSGVPFNWQIITVPGVGHQGAKMANTAVQVINAYFDSKTKKDWGFNTSVLLI